MERVDAWAHLKLLLSVPPETAWRQVGWDNDQLDAVLDAIPRGDGGRQKRQQHRGSPASLRVVSHQGSGPPSRRKRSVASQDRSRRVMLVGGRRRTSAARAVFDRSRWLAFAWPKL